MSRVGNKIIKVAAGTVVTVGESNFVTVKGPKGELSFKFSPAMTIHVDGDTVKISRPDDSIENRTIHGTTRALLHNMVEGVTNGFTKVLEIQGTGYRAQMKDGKLVINAGYSHQVFMELPVGITVVCPTQTEVVVSGSDKQVVGQFASEIRAVRKPEPYKGKGIRYKGEQVRRKEGKKAK